jgi:hypothetical protein
MCFYGDSSRSNKSILFTFCISFGNLPSRLNIYGAPYRYLKDWNKNEMFPRTVLFLGVVWCGVRGILLVSHMDTRMTLCLLCCGSTKCFLVAITRFHVAVTTTVPAWPASLHRDVFLFVHFFFSLTYCRLSQFTNCEPFWTFVALPGQEEACRNGSTRTSQTNRNTPPWTEWDSDPGPQCSSSPTLFTPDPGPLLLPSLF